ncbi:MAG TPA: Wzt carbohydrate-binding domain-containing protein [Bryobacteraceae bacterium]|nr:Wzt carbohydrate-binding domain-containing protein [Bryobacteraceae bacterium]
MGIEFRSAARSPLQPLSATIPDGFVVGVVGANGSGQEQLARLAGGLDLPSSGEILAREPRRFIGPEDTLEFEGSETLIVYHALAFQDAFSRAQAAVGLEKLRRRKGAALLVSNEPELLVSLCDEIWWLDSGRLMARGNPREMLDCYQRSVMKRLRAWGETVSGVIPPVMRRGDGRAQLIAFETLDENDRHTTVWQSGTMVGVRVSVRFEQPVEDPVVGILIRTRVGLDVYGTNSELENVKLGPCASGDVRTVTFRFLCTLCPQECTITAASHDPDGVWHDWIEEGLMLEITDNRYTAGVANLRARVEVIPR